MKFILAICVFFLLATGSKSMANTTNTEQSSKEAPAQETEVCKPDENKKCDTAHEATVHNGHGKTSSKDWSHKRETQVAAIMPEKQKDAAQSNRPAAVKLVSPQFLAQIAGNSAKLEWTADSKAKFYHIQVSKDAGFNNRSMYVADEKWVQGTSFEVTNLEPGKKYFWRVAAVNNENDSMFTKSLFVSSAFETH